MSETSTGAGAPPGADAPPKPTVDTKGAKPNPENLRSREAAKKIVDSRIREVNAKARKGEVLSTAEENILAIDVIRTTGFTPDVYANPKFADGVPLDGGISITIQDSDGSDIALTVQTIKKQEGKPPKYFCVDPRDPAKFVEVTADAMAKGFIARSITDLASDPGQQEIVSWYANGEQGTPPTEAVDKEMDPMNQANKVIKRRLDELREALQALDDKDKDGRKKIAAEIQGLEVALRADGAELGAIYKMRGLQVIAAAKMGTPDAAQIADAITGLDQQTAESLVRFADLLTAAGADKEFIDKIRAGDTDVIFTDKKFQKQMGKIPDIDQKFYGTQVPTDAEVATLKEQLTSEQKAVVEAAEAEEGEGKSKAWLILLIHGILTSPITIPTAALVGAAPAFAGALSGAGHQ